MNADDFIEHVRQAMPSSDALREHGLDDDDIASIQALFVAKLSAAPEFCPIR